MNYSRPVDASPSYVEIKEDVLEQASTRWPLLRLLYFLSSPTIKLSQGAIITPALTLEVSDAVKPSPVPFHCASFDDIDSWIGDGGEGRGKVSDRVNDSRPVLPLPSPCSYYA
jgi:hypothetical protein